ncbi:MAG: zinc carboxypeptidase, partial [bacterium]
GMGSYKSFVIKADARREVYLQKLLTLLDAHGIEYKCGTAATAKGYNYATAKEETFSVTSADVVINTAQANAALVQVLFEPRTKLADSATYDITAWSLPYAYGLHAYATKERVVQGANWKPSSM